MNIGIGAGTVVTGYAEAADLWQAVVHAVGTVAVRAGVAGGCSAVRRIVVTGSAVGKNKGRAGRMTIAAGASDAAFSRSLQIGSMAQRTGGREIAGGFVTVGGCPAPGGIRVGGILRVAVFTAVGQAAHRHIETRVAAGTAGRGPRVAFLTVGQIGFGFRPVQRRVSKRNCMRSAGTGGMTTGRRPGGIGEAGGKATGCRRIGSGSTLGKIVTDRAGGVLVQGVSVAGQVVDGNIVGSLPTGRVRPRIEMTLRRRATCRCRAAIEPDGARRTMTLLAIGKIFLGLRTMQGCIRKRYGVGHTGTAGMASGRRPVGIGEVGRKATGRIGVGTGRIRVHIMAEGTGNIHRSGPAVAGQVSAGGIIGALPVGRVGPRGRMALRRRTGRNGNRPVKLNGTGRAVALLAGSQIGPGIGAMGIGIRIGKRMRGDKSRTVGMTSAGDAVTVGKIWRKAAGCVRDRARAGPIGFVAQAAAAIHGFQRYCSVGGVIGRIPIVIGPLPVGWVRSGGWMAGSSRAGTGRIVEKIRIGHHAAGEIAQCLAVTPPA